MISFKRFAQREPMLSELNGYAFPRLMASRARKQWDRTTIRQTFKGDSVPMLDHNPDKTWKEVKALIADKKGEQVIRRMKPLLDNAPADPSINQSLAFAYQSEGRYELAITHYLVALEHHQNKNEILNHLGTCYRALGNFPEAKKYHTRALVNDGGDRFAYHGLLDSYLCTRDYEGILWLMKRFGSNITPDREILRVYAAFWIDTYCWEDALRCFTHSDKHENEDSLHYCFVGFFWNRISTTGGGINLMLRAGHHFKALGYTRLADKFFEFVNNAH